MKELLHHPWLTKETDSMSVPWQSMCEKKQLNQDCVDEMALYFGKSKKDMISTIKQWKYDETTAIYFILLSNKYRGCNIRLHPRARPLTEKVNF